MSNHFQTEKLSDQGQRRRDKMLVDLKSEMRGVHRRRTQTRTFVAVLGVGIVAGTCLWWSLGLETTPEKNRVAGIQSRPSVESPIVNATVRSGPPSKVFCSVERNRDEVIEKYVVKRKSPVSELSFDRFGDQGLASEQVLKSLLAEFQVAAVVGRIGGELRAVPVKSFSRN